MNITDSMMMMSPIKREQLIKRAKQKRKLEMRAELPVLNRFQIRRHRLSLHKALVEELHETGFLSSASFLQQLIDHHERIREEHGPDTPVYCRRRLIEADDVLVTLCDEFQKAEKAHNNGQYSKEFDILLQLGIEYALGINDDWWWLGEQILYQCVNIGNAYQGDGGMREAMARYIMGKFLLEKMKDPYITTQMEYLGKCRQLSKGMKWSARNVLGIKQDTLFVESARLTLQALLLEAKETKKYDPHKAVRLCQIARKRANDSCDRAAEAEVLKLMGKCEMDCDNPKSSCETFYRSLVLNLKLNNLIEVCQIRILLALAYLKVENYADALYQLETLLAFAKENNLTYYIGQAYRYLGEIYINKGQPELATPILAEAVKIFVDGNDAYNRRRTKNLSAISGGQEHIANYIKLIINCGRSGSEGRSYLMTLLRWKDNRTPFWIEGEPVDYKLDYPEILYGQIEKNENLIHDLAHLHKEDASEMNIIEEVAGAAEEEFEEEEQIPSMEEKPTSESEMSEEVQGEGMDIFNNEQFLEQSPSEIPLGEHIGDEEIFGEIEDGAQKMIIDEYIEDEGELTTFAFDEENIGEEMGVGTTGQNESGEKGPEEKPAALKEGFVEENAIEMFHGEEEYIDSEAEDVTRRTEGEPEEIDLGQEEIFE